MKVENGHKTKLLTLLKASTRGGKKSFRQWFFVRFMKAKVTEPQNYLFFSDSSSGFLAENSQRKASYSVSKI